MQKIFRYRKVVGLTVLISTFLICFSLSPARAVMITTEYVIHQDSKQLSARARVRAFLSRTDVTAQMQAYGISPEEALSRVDSLTDSEIASLAGKIDQIPAGAGTNFSADGSLLSFIGMALYALFAAILLYFSFTGEKEKKP
ncbi:MAG: PA2779 family protein [Desulfobacterales bacterium]|nr:PA2779 family protein [Desulfobacterales bacterium]MDH3827160.1 PA2779 family protein [Desulfobacterales bacterium]MDH4009254.1 PA2779 family protein [Desulfobacterales bacterium]